MGRKFIELEEYCSKSVFLHSANQTQKILATLELACSPKQQQYFRLYYIEKKTMKQIAKKCGVSAPTVSKTLARARKAISSVQVFFTGGAA